MFSISKLNIVNKNVFLRYLIGIITLNQNKTKNLIIIIEFRFEYY